MTDVEPMIQAERKELVQQNRARKLAGLPLLKAKNCSCLKCGKKFESMKNRLCRDCRGGIQPCLSGRTVT